MDPLFFYLDLSVPEEATMYHYKFPEITRTNIYGEEEDFGRLAKVNIAGIDVYIASHRVEPRFGKLGAVEEVPEFLTDLYINCCETGGNGNSYVYITDKAHIWPVCQYLSKQRDKFSDIFVSGSRYSVLISFKDGVGARTHNPREQLMTEAEREYYRLPVAGVEV